MFKIALMCEKDVRIKRNDQPRNVPELNFVNIHKIPEQVTRWDANAELQDEKPDW